MLPLIAAGAAIKAAGAIAQEFLPGLVGKFAGEKGEAVARAVVDAASEATGLDAGQDPDSAVKRLRVDSAALLTFKARLLDHDEVMARLANDDRADARARDVSIRTLGQKNYRADVLAGLIVALFSVVVLAFVFHVDELKNTQVLLLLLGHLVAMVGAVIQFEFGSSRGSKDKDQRGLRDE